jgi:hypothetical protein
VSPQVKASKNRAREAGAFLPLAMQARPPWRAVTLRLMPGERPRGKVTIKDRD